MKVKDVMEPVTNWLTPDMSLREAVQVMRSTKRGHGLSVNGIVVLDEAMNLIGIVSTKDILRLIIPEHVFFEERHSDVSWESIRREKSAMAENLQVGDIMMEDVRVISAEESLLRCADVFLTEQVRRLPVVRSDGKVVGVVYLRDVYNALTRLLLE